MDIIREKCPEMAEGHKYVFLMVNTDDGSEVDYTQLEIDDLPIVRFEL